MKNFLATVIFSQVLIANCVAASGLDYPIKFSTKNNNKASLQIRGDGSEAKCLIQVGQDEEYKLNFLVDPISRHFTFFKEVDLELGIVELYLNCSRSYTLVSFALCIPELSECKEITRDLFPESIVPNTNIVDIGHLGEIYKRIKITK